MAQDTFNTLPSATAIEDTDGIIIKPSGSPEKKATITTLKANFDGRYQKLGEVIFTSINGSSFLPATFTVGHEYLIYMNTQYLFDEYGSYFIGRQIIDFIYTADAVIDINIYSGISGAGTNEINSFSITSSGISRPAGGEGRIFKIVDMGVAQ